MVKPVFLFVFAFLRLSHVILNWILGAGNWNSHRCIVAICMLLHKRKENRNPPVHNFTCKGTIPRKPYREIRRDIGLSRSISRRALSSSRHWSTLRLAPGGIWKEKRHLKEAIVRRGERLKKRVDIFSCLVLNRVKKCITRVLRLVCLYVQQFTDLFAWLSDLQTRNFTRDEVLLSSVVACTSSKCA